MRMIFWDKNCFFFCFSFFFLALFGPGSPTDHCSAHANLPTQYIYESLSKKISIQSAVIPLP